MTQHPSPPIPALVPQTAPFSPEQRAWLNGFLAGYLGLDSGGITALSPEEGTALARGG
jgi:sulfite reductase (NADPH) flavoprotein alpha-component